MIDESKTKYMEITPSSIPPTFQFGNQFSVSLNLNIFGSTPWIDGLSAVRSVPIKDDANT
jgi:hypothetical protein